MACGGRGDLAGYAAKSLLDQLLQAPAGAVAGEHAQIVQVDVAVAVGLADLLVIHLAEPVVGGDGAGVGEDQAAHRVGDGGVFLHAPVLNVQILVHRLLVVQEGGLHVAHFLPLLAVENVGLGHGLVAAAGENGLHAVLNILHGHKPVLDLGQEISRDLQGEKVDHALVILCLGGVKGFFDGVGDLVDVEVDDFSVSFYYLVHIFISSHISG